MKTRYPSGDEQRRNNRRNINVSVAYTVTAPAGTRITINSISGGIKVTDIKGDINANSISGDVRISGAGRDRRGEDDLGHGGDCRDPGATAPSPGSSVSGDVILRRVTARRLDAGSVSGNIKLEDVQCERVSAGDHERERLVRRHARAQRALRAQFLLRRSPRRCSPATPASRSTPTPSPATFAPSLPITTRGTSSARARPAQDAQRHLRRRRRRARPDDLQRVHRDFETVSAVREPPTHS